MTRYVIEAAVLKIKVIADFAHNFWILKDADTNTMVAQLQGLATSRDTHEIKPVGTFNDQLTAYHLVYDPQFAHNHGYPINNYKLAYNECQRIYEKEDALSIWKKAVEAVKLINVLNLNYPPGGVNWLNINNTINSNTVYHTFADAMGIDNYKFPNYIYIGVENSLFNQIRDQLTTASLQNVTKPEIKSENTTSAQQLALFGINRQPSSQARNDSSESQTFITERRDKNECRIS